MNTWESYKKHKQRRNTRDSGDNNNQAFAMLVSNAINVASSTSHLPETEEKKPDIIEELEEKPRTNRWVKVILVHFRRFIITVI